MTVDGPWVLPAYSNGKREPDTRPVESDGDGTRYSRHAPQTPRGIAPSSQLWLEPDDPIAVGALKFPIGPSTNDDLPGAEP